jgi:hypothetical protein
MSLDGLQLALFFTPPYPIERAVGMGRALMKALGRFRGDAPDVLEPSAHLLNVDRDEAFENGYGILTLCYPSLGNLQSATIMQAQESPWARLTVSMSLMAETRADVATCWEYMLAAAPRAVSELKPSLAFVGALADIPKPKSLTPKRLPKTFTAWTFLGGEVLDAAKSEALTTLPDAHEIRAHASGMIVQAVPDLYGAPSKALLAAFKALPDGGSSYKQSRAKP